MNPPRENLKKPDASKPRAGPPGLVIRATEPRDCSGLAMLSNLPAYRAGTARLPFQSEEETARWLASDGVAAGGPRIVAELDGTIVGAAGLHRGQGRRQHSAVLGIGVHDDHHGRGIGSALMEALLDAAFNWLQIRRVELTVFTDNHAAIALYERFGFEREGIFRAYAFRNGCYADVVAMALLTPDLRSAGAVS